MKEKKNFTVQLTDDLRQEMDVVVEQRVKDGLSASRVGLIKEAIIGYLAMEEKPEPGQHSGAKIPFPVSWGLDLNDRVEDELRRQRDQGLRTSKGNIVRDALRALIDKTV